MSITNLLYRVRVEGDIRRRKTTSPPLAPPPPPFTPLEDDFFDRADDLNDDGEDAEE